MNTHTPLLYVARGMRSAAFLALALAPAIVPAQTTPTANGTPQAQEPPTVELNPFEVSAELDRGYDATNTASGTRTNEPLRNLPNAISILNKQFLDDIAANDLFDAMSFMVGMEAEEGGPSGQGGNSGMQINVRGIATNWQSRGGFQWYVPTDIFNTERLESNRGASGQLYGDVGAGGILNIGTKAAQFRDRNSFQTRVDNFGQRRISGDFNRVIRPWWATRFNAVASEGGNWRDGPSNDNISFALANSFKLGRRTTLRIDGEMGEINNRSAQNLAIDEFGDYAIATPGTTAPDVDPTTPGIQAQYTLTANNALGNPQTYNTTSTIGAAGVNQQWRVINGQLVSLESTASNVYRQTTVDGTRRIDAERIIPREQQWNGPDNTADRDYHTVTALLTHQFNDKLWAEFAYNLQDQTNTTWTGAANTVRRDPNPFIPASGTLSGASVVANPYFNELYVEHVWDNAIVTNRVHNYRVTTAYNWDVFSWMQQRVITSLAYRDEAFTSSAFIESLDQAQVAALGLTGATGNLGNNRITRRHYLRDGNGDDTLARSTVPGVVRYSAGAGFNAQQWQSLTSGSVNLLGNYFDGLVRTTIGYRRDFWNKDVIDAVQSPIGEATFPGEKRDFQDIFNTSWNYGAVITPISWASLVYNYSETFVANATGFLFDGSDIQPQQGDGFDVGLRLSLLNERIYASATYFEATNANVFQNNIVAGQANNLNTVLGEIVNILGPVNTETGRPFTGGGANGRDVQDRASQGWEFELVANPSNNWTVRAALTITKAGNFERARQLRSVYERMLAAVNAPGSGFTTTDYENTTLVINNLRDDDPRDIWRPTVSTRYTFSEGRLRGGFVGGNLIWFDEQKIADTRASDTIDPVTLEVIPGQLTRRGFEIDAYTAINLFGGYTWRLKEGRSLQAQLNVNNVFDETPRLGGYANGRYPNPRQFLGTFTYNF